ncbi:related to small s protein [Phialocephala subalpina]|uniref:Related to small s protein n=1 Tax=Phialocephala subalpina TaxID=576137 RepID=A0A1L7WLF5_9HELO|nr:related to small s protein [Phialocephala subalpina]
MDPLTCLSIAGNVVQFIDFSFKIYSDTRQLYEDGRLQVHDQTKKAVEDLSKFSKSLSQSTRGQHNTGGITENDVELEAICQHCRKLADDMVVRLKKFDVSKKDNVFRSVCQVLKSMWSAEELAKAEKTLAGYRDMLNSRLLGSLGERVDKVLEQQYNQIVVNNDHTRQIKDTTRRVVASALFEFHVSLSQDLQEHTRMISALVDRNVRNFHDMDKLHGGHYSDVRQRSSGVATTEEDAQAYFNIQQNEAVLYKGIVSEIAKSLRYETIDERYESVSEAHQKTFEWIFDPIDESEDPEQAHWSDFVTWLRSGNGIYWINGKAGSGKSTLMKFIYEDPRTQEHLKVWGGETPVHTAIFFFWWRGTKLQKSQDGLLRSLLYAVLQQMPELVPFVLPSQWASLYAAKTNTSKIPAANIWTSSALSRAFQALQAQKQSSVKLCLFIDGLDEYDGLEVDIAKLFKGVILSPCVKVCVSSRPHVPFEDAFADYPSLRLQTLTRPDIDQYIQDRLVYNELMEPLKIQEPKECQQLVEEIAETAEGVFLWVILVVSSLINGLGNHDRISDLQERLKALPRDLDLLYEEMVVKIDGIYAAEASRLYQLVAEATPRPGDWERAEPLSLRSLSLALTPNLNINNALTTPALDEKTLLEQAKRMDVLLKTRCGGLLEVQYGKAKMEDLSSSMKVSYLHRTVRDFLEARSTRQVLLERTGGFEKATFKPTVAIFTSIAIQVNHLDPIALKASSLPYRGLIYAQRIDADDRISAPELLNLFDTFAQAARWKSVIAFTINCSLNRYLDVRLRDENALKHDSITKPVLDALVPTSDGEPFVDAATVSFLIKTGANPNTRFSGSTPWENCLSYLICNRSRLYGPILRRWADIVVVLLEEGADPTTTCVGPDRFEYRGKRRAKVKVGNTWKVSEVIDKTFVTLPLILTNLERVHKKAIQEAKDARRGDASTSAVDRVLSPRDGVEKPETIVAATPTSREHTPRSKIFLCCHQ